MKRNQKVTLIVAVATLVSSVSIAGYNKHQQAVFTAANPLFEENIEAIADDGVLGYLVTWLFGDSEKKKQEARDRYIAEHPTMVYGHELTGSKCPSSGTSSRETVSHTESSVNGGINGGIGTGGLWDVNGGISGGVSQSSGTRENNEDNFSGSMEYDCKSVEDEDALCDRCAAVKCDGSPRYPSICH